MKCYSKPPTGGSDNDKRRMRANALCVVIGFALLCFSVLCFAAKGMTEAVTGAGGSEQNFFLLPVGGVLLACGVAVFVLTGIKNTFILLRSQNYHMKMESLRTLTVCITVILFCSGIVMFLMEANSDAHTTPVCLACLAASFAAWLASLFLRAKETEKRNEP